jgi:quercetin dioxygenase-like cupin family protein
MQVTRVRPDSQAGPSEWFTGEVWLDNIAAPPAPARLRAVSVHFTPGARTAWHTHPFGQVIHVTEGVGRAQSRGGAVEEIRAGDSVHFDPGEEHWHGAGPTTFMTHLALQEADEQGVNAHWGDHVTEDEYLGADQR